MLQVFAYLYPHGETSFPDLTDALDTTQGNLASHMQKLEDAGCVEVEKQFVDRKPQSTHQLTETGREKLEEQSKRWKRSSRAWTNNAARETAFPGSSGNRTPISERTNSTHTSERKPVSDGCYL